MIAGLGDENNVVGRACVAPDGIEPAMVKADCFRFRLNGEKVLPEFIAMQLSASAKYDSGVLATGSTRSRMPLSVNASRAIVYPNVREQQNCVAYVNTLMADFAELEEQAGRAILLLQERRTALISAAVTGKIDVCYLASHEAARRDQ